MSTPKVTVQKPSEQILAAAASDVQTVTAGAMILGLKKPNVLQQYRVVEMVGDSAKNQVYMAMIMPLFWIVQIDGEPQLMPSTKRELEALIQRLGDAGIEALVTHFSPKDENEADNGASVEEESIKN